MSGLAARLRTLDGAKIAVLRNKKLGSEAVAETVSSTLASEYGARTRTWVKSSPYAPVSRKMRREMIEWAEGVVACPGDCGHGSAVLRHDIFQLEAAGLPVAWIDTPGRMPKVTRRGRVFTIEYGATRFLEGAVWRVGGLETPLGRVVALKMFEKFGLHRVLRLAGARAGDTVRVGSFEVVLWEYPPKLLDGWDGVLDLPYVEIPTFRATNDETLRDRIRERAPEVVRLLVGDE